MPVFFVTKPPPQCAVFQYSSPADEPLCLHNEQIMLTAALIDTSSIASIREEFYPGQAPGAGSRLAWSCGYRKIAFDGCLRNDKYLNLSNVLNYQRASLDQALR